MAVLCAGGLQQTGPSGAQVSAASVSEGRRLLGAGSKAGSSGGGGSKAPGARWGLLQGLRRLLLLSPEPDQAPADSPPHLQLGSASAGGALRQGVVQREPQAPAPAPQEQDRKPVRVQGVQLAPLIALQATSFLDVGAPTKAVQPAAAPSHGVSLPCSITAPILVGLS